MNDLTITKVLTNNGSTIAYELSNGRQITLENAFELVKEGTLSNVTSTIDSTGKEVLTCSSNIPFENINKPSD